mmetsp:Transcript_27433/g.77615  ORF Transcript_27433/g.77615 Transcript_27433/m.77615 type:complete len:277 (-) Transcript_27433:776-1606(-)
MVVLKLLADVFHASVLSLLQGVVQLQHIVDLCHLVEVLGVWHPQGPHPIDMPPLLEVPLKRAAAPVRSVAADLALELLVQTVQLVEPVRDGLAIPSQWQLQRVVDVLVFLVAVVFQLSLLCLLKFGLELVVGAGLLLLNVGYGLIHHRGHKAHQEGHTALEEGGLASRATLLLALRRRQNCCWRGPLGEKLLVKALQRPPLHHHQPLRPLLQSASGLEAQLLQGLLEAVRPQGGQLLRGLKGLEVDVCLQLGGNLPLAFVLPPVDLPGIKLLIKLV